MRHGDYIVLLSFCLNIFCALAYGYQHFWAMVLYFCGAAFINLSLILMWLYK